MAHYYTKINAPFVRDSVTGGMTDIYVDQYAPLLDRFGNWVFTEKVDGTSVLVHWDGDKVVFYGHTTKSRIPQAHLDWLGSRFGTEGFESLLEQFFGDKPVSLYGELFGGNINNGSRYSDDYQFLVFDVSIGSVVSDKGVEVRAAWLDWEGVKDVCGKLGVHHVPEVDTDTTLQGASTMVGGFQSIVSSMFGKPPCPAEGFVARPRAVFLTREGSYIRYKIKRRDYQ